MKLSLARCLWLLAALPAYAVVSRVAPASSQSEQTAAPPADDAQCTTCQGVELLNSGQYARAMHVFQLRAAQGDAVAMNNIGYMYQEGLGVPVDMANARRYFLMSANAGGGIGMSSLG